MTRPRLSEFRSALVATSVADGIARLLGAATVVVLVRHLAVADYAFMTLFLALGQLITSAAGSGIRMQYLLTQAEHASRGDPRAATPPMRLAVAARMQACVTAVFVGAGALVSLAFGLEADGHALTVVFTLAGLYALGHSGIELVVMHHQALKRFRTAGAISIVRNAIILALSLLPFVGVAGGETLALSYGLGMTAAAAILARPVIRVQRCSGRRPSKHRLAESVGWLSAYFIASACFTYTGVFVVGALLSSRELASFGAAQRYLAIALGLFPALLSVLRVRSSQVDMVDSREAQVTMLRRWLRLATPVAAVLLGIAAIFADDLVRIADNGRYPESVRILRVMLLFAFLAYLTAPAAALLMTQRRHRRLAIGMAAAATVNLAAGAALTVTVGAVGMALTTALTFGVLGFSQSRLVLRPGPEVVDAANAGATGQSIRRARTHAVSR